MLALGSAVPQGTLRICMPAHPLHCSHRAQGHCMSSLEVFLLPLLVECSFIGGANDGPAGVASRAVSHQMPSLGVALGASAPTQYLVSGMHWSICFPCCSCFVLAVGISGVV